jgi:hypothetical protein
VGSRGTAGRLRYHVESLRPNSTFNLDFRFNDDFCPVITFSRSGRTMWEHSIPRRLGTTNSLSYLRDANYGAVLKFLRAWFIRVTTEVIDGRKMWVIDVERLHDDSN